MEKSIKRRLIAWAEERPPIVSLFAIAAVGAVRELAEMMQAVREEPEWWPAYASWMREDWDRYWSSPEAWAVDLARDLGWLPSADETKQDAESRKLEIAIRLVARWLVTGEPPLRLRKVVKDAILGTSERDFKTWTRFSQRYYRVSLPHVIDYFLLPPDPARKSELIEESDQLHKLTLESAALQFLFRVVAPCTAELGRSPWVVVEEATSLSKPNWGLLETIVRIDRRVANHRRVLDLCDERRYTKPAVRRIAKVLNKAPRKRPLKEWKNRTAGWISRVAESVGYPITEPEIRQLFDLAAMARGKEQQDNDLPPSQEALRKSIQRYRPHLKVIRHLDTNALAYVRALHARAA